MKLIHWTTIVISNLQNERLNLDIFAAKFDAE